MLSRLRSTRGSVLVLVAAAMFPLAGMLAFVIDVSHWFDYSRNLQNRADAAALAAGAQYGSTCFEGNQGDVWTGLQSQIGKWGQFYAGPGTTAQGATEQGSAAGSNNANVPYTAASVFSATGGAAYKNPPNLTKGPLANYYVRLNATNYYDKGTPANFSMGDFCTTTPAQDFSDSSAQQGPMVDVKVTQFQLGNFIPIFGAIGPNIEAHARVQLQNIGSASNPTPIAVRDAGFTPCVSVNFVNASTNAVIQNVPLQKKAQAGVTVTWDNSAAPAAIPIPAGNIYIQPVLSDCKGNNETYDDSTNTGLLYINSHPASDPAIAAGQAPKLTSGGVTMVNGTCAPDQYFTTKACSATISAWIEFQPQGVGQPALNSGDVIVKAIDHESGGTTNTYTLTPTSFQPGVPVQFTGTVPIGANDGIKRFEITWEQTNNSVTGYGNCKKGGNNPCTDTFGIQQEAFGACDGCDQPDDSGPMVLAQLSQSGGGNLTNSLATGSTPNLVVTLQLASLAAAQPGDPPIVLRFGSGQQTGLVDCGQGNGASSDATAIQYGCGPNDTHFTPRLNPLFVNTRNGDCTNPPWPMINHQDCVQTTPGNRRNKIPGAFVARITGANGCAGAKNNWPNPGPNDPRAITMIITSDVDLTLAHNGSQAWIPIWQFATFYVTGWDTQEKPVCGDNDPFPGGGKKNQQNATIWGHWMSYTDNTGTGNGSGCTLNALGNCVPVLTR